MCFMVKINGLKSNIFIYTFFHASLFLILIEMLSFHPRRDNVLRLWNYLLELLQARRMRLELTLSLYKVFKEMLYILDWMEEIKVNKLL